MRADPGAIGLLLDGELGLGAELVGVADPEDEDALRGLGGQVAFHEAGVRELLEDAGHGGAWRGRWWLRRIRGRWWGGRRRRSRWGHRRRRRHVPGTGRPPVFFFRVQTGHEFPNGREPRGQPKDALPIALPVGALLQHGLAVGGDQGNRDAVLLGDGDVSYRRHWNKFWEWLWDIGLDRAAPPRPPPPPARQNAPVSDHPAGGTKHRTGIQISFIVHLQQVARLERVALNHLPRQSPPPSPRPRAHRRPLQKHPPPANPSADRSPS